jgi:hypothetical protein
MKFICLMIFFLLLTGVVRSQDISLTSLVWQVNRLEDFNANSTMDYQCTFVTEGTTGIEWNQKGNYNTNLEVVSITGTWLNVEAVGKVTYEITMEGDPGTMIFEKTTGGTYITLEVSQGNSAQMKYRFTVRQVTIK